MKRAAHVSCSKLFELPKVLLKNRTKLLNMRLSKHSNKIKNYKFNQFNLTFGTNLINKNTKINREATIPIEVHEA